MTRIICIATLFVVPLTTSVSDAATEVYFADFDEILHFSAGQSVIGIYSGGRPSAIALNVAGGKLYWTDLIAGVNRSNLDGTASENLVAGLGETRGIDLDLAGGMMYWIEQTTTFDKIFRANLNGTGREELPITGLYNAFGIALDTTHGKVYWTDAGHDGVPNSDRIMRADLDGSNAELLIDTALHFPFEIALDVAGGKMYWADGGGGGQNGPSTINRANLDGTDLELLVSGSIIPYGIDLDLSEGKMYWTDHTNRIRRANLDGTNVEDVLTSGFDTPMGIAVDNMSPAIVPEPCGLTLWTLAIGAILVFRTIKLKSTAHSHGPTAKYPLSSC